MADQSIILNLQGPEGPEGLRIEVVDTDGSAAKFTDLGDATSWVADADYQVVSVQPVGSTAPAAVFTVQVNRNRLDRNKFLNLPAIFDPKSSMADRLGSVANAVIPRGTTLRLISRA